MKTADPAIAAYRSAKLDLLKGSRSAELQAATEAERQAAIEYERQSKAARVANLFGFLQNNGSCGLVVLTKQGRALQDVKNNLVDLQKTETGERTYFLPAGGNLRGGRKTPAEAAKTVASLKAYEDETGKDGLIIITDYDFGETDDSGSPTVRNFLSATINRGKSPKLLAIGNGAWSDMRSNCQYEPGDRSVLTLQLAGTWAIRGGAILGQLKENVPTVGQGMAHGTGTSFNSLPVTPDEHEIPLGCKRL